MTTYETQKIDGVFYCIDDANAIQYAKRKEALRRSCEAERVRSYDYGLQYSLSEQYRQARAFGQHPQQNSVFRGLGSVFGNPWSTFGT